MVAKFTGFVKLTDPTNVIVKKTMDAMANELNKILARSLPRIENGIRNIIAQRISSAPEIKSLQSGDLRKDFGIPAGQDPKASIITSIVNTVHVKRKHIRPIKAGVFEGGLEINLQPQSFANLLAAPEAFVTTEKGVNLPWLSWLLESGDKIIVGGFGVKYKANTGRSGGATMSPDFRPFRVRPSFSGTSDKNFIHRAFIGSEPEITKAIVRNLL